MSTGAELDALIEELTVESPDGRYVACTSFSGDLITVRLHGDKQTIIRRRPPSANFLPTDITWRTLPGT